MADQSEYPKKVFLNGDILDARDARISVFDRGFIFGDGIYEVMAQINGRFFYKEPHMVRLKRSLNEVGIHVDVEAIEQQIPVLLEASDLTEKDCILYIQVSRGVAPRQHSYPKNISPTVMMYAWAQTLPGINTSHAAVVTKKDIRWSRCDIKMTSLLGNVMAKEHAITNGCFETLLERNGRITEASHCNVFFVKDEVIYTHPAGPFILDGITRQVVLELCETLGIPVRQEGVPAKDIQDMDEAFLTGTGAQVLAIKEVDGYQYFETDPGPVTRRVQEAFLELKKSHSF